jgi:hypothetical protein
MKDAANCAIVLKTEIKQIQNMIVCLLSEK